MTHIFVSYSRKDLTFIERLAADLTQHGCDVWYDVSNLGGGSRWNKAIEQAIKDSQYVVVVLSPDSVASTWVDDEVAFARMHKKKIVPLYYRPCEIGLVYVNLNWIDAQAEKYKSNFDKILQALDVKPVSQPSTPPKPAPAEKASKPGVVINGNVTNSNVIVGNGNKTSNVQARRVEAHKVEARKVEAHKVEAHKVPVYNVPIRNVTAPNLPPSKKLTLSNGMDFVRVPAGKFIMGSNNGRDSEKPQHTVDVPHDYWMGRYPVTNAQYNQFKKKDFDKGKESHPVVRVTWDEAMEYCKWLNQILNSEFKNLNLAAHLPTEAEWEKAARGTDGREYPWGNGFDKNKCNSKESGKGTTTPVGFYSPQGDSPYSCADMAGNVWEWTHSEYKPYPYNATDGREDEQKSVARVLRGGSYVIVGSYLRCAIRGYYDPFVRYDDIGFRVVVCVSSPISPKGFCFWILISALLVSEHFSPEGRVVFLKIWMS